jgi:hypothetical protein
MRSVLQIVQDAAPKIGIARPDYLMTSTGTTETELAALANELAERIARAHDWSLLKTLETHTGDGVTEGYTLPTDYLRMPKDGQIWSSRWQRPMLPISSDDWLRLEIREYDLIVGTWIMLGGEIKYRPVLTDTETAKFYYISADVVHPATGSNKARFTLDTDTFRLGDRLLELHIIWEWRYRKGLAYGEDMATAEAALAQAISEDKGARMIVQSSRRNIHGKTSYPWNVGV